MIVLTSLNGVSPLRVPPRSLTFPCLPKPVTLPQLQCFFVPLIE